MRISGVQEGMLVQLGITEIRQLQTASVKHARVRTCLGAWHAARYCQAGHAI